MVVTSDETFCGYYWVYRNTVSSIRFIGEILRIDLRSFMLKRFRSLRKSNNMRQ